MSYEALGRRSAAHDLWQLKQEAEISSEDYWDSELRADLEDVVREELESELSCEECSAEVKDLVCEIIDDVVK